MNQPLLHSQRMPPKRQLTHTTISTYQTGLMGEDVVAATLKSRSWRIIARRARTRWGEVDLVARRGTTIVFVEVKFAGARRVDVARVIDARAQHRLRRAAVAWMATNPTLQRDVRHYRFDVYLVRRDDAGVVTLDHLANAF